MRPGVLATRGTWAAKKPTMQQVESSLAALVLATFGQAESSKLELSAKAASSLRPIQVATIVAALFYAFM